MQEAIQGQSQDHIPSQNPDQSQGQSQGQSLDQDPDQSKYLCLREMIKLIWI